MSLLEPLINDVNHPLMRAALDGLRPPVDPRRPLPKSLVRFAVESITYKVKTEGTLVYMYGPDEDGRDVMLRASGNYPYLYVKIVPGVDARGLVDELQATILASLAHEGAAKMAKHGNVSDTDTRAAITGFAGLIHWTGGKVYTLGPPADAARFLPIVGYETVLASIGRGFGGDYGYNGIDPDTLLKIYFFSPSLLVRAKKLLHGKNAPLGYREQAKLLNASFDARVKEMEEVAAKQKALTESTGGGDRKTGIWSYITPRAATSADADLSKAIFDNLDDNICETLDELDEVADEFRAMDDDLVHRGDEDDDPEENYDTGAGDEWSLDAQNQGTGILTDDGLPALAVGTTRTDADNMRRQLFDLFKRNALGALETVRGGNRGVLSTLTEEKPLIVCNGDIEFVINFMLRCHFRAEMFIQVDLAAPTLSPQSYRDDRANGLPHSADGHHAGFPDSTWMLADTPPGIPPLEPTLYRVNPLDRSKDRAESRQQIELRGDWHHIKVCDDDALQNTVPSGVTLSFDIETRVGPGGKFPRPETEDVLQIVCVIPYLPRMKKKKKWRSVAFCRDQLACGEPSSDFDEFILCFDGEKIMLLAFCTFVRQLMASTIITFNGDNFDFVFLAKRAQLLGIGYEFMHAWSKLAERSPIRMTPRSFKNKAQGRHESIEVKIEGVNNIDVHQLVKRNPLIRLPNYDLNSVAAHFLKENKVDMPPSMINTSQLTPAGRRELYIYCKHDSLLPLLLIGKKKWQLALIEKARITGCTLTMLMQRGMGVQGKAVVYGASMEEGIFIPELAAQIGVADAGKKRLCVCYTRTDYDRSIERGYYEGAVVIDPMRGLYVIIVATLDFNSLYPTTQISNNMCVFTLVRMGYHIWGDRWIKFLLSTGRFAQEDLVHFIRSVKKEATIAGAPFEDEVAEGAAVFVDPIVLPGMLPAIQRKFITRRKQVRATMKPLEKEIKALEALPSTDLVKVDGVDVTVDERLTNIVATYEVLDERQIGNKLVGNSLYGLDGSDKSFRFSPGIASSVTASGRMLIIFARWVTERVLLHLNDHAELVADVEQFPGVSNPLVKLPSGKKAVEALRAAIAALRASATRRPMPMRRAKSAAKKQVGKKLADYLNTKRKGTTLVTTEDANAILDGDLMIRVIYGDTDSIFPLFWEGAEEELVADFCIASADFISIVIHRRYGNRHDINVCVYRIEFEKQFESFLLLAKKRYAGLKKVRNGETGELESKPEKGVPTLSGMESNRRDTTKLVARGLEKIIAILLDPRFTTDINKRRARAYVSIFMVQPLKSGLVDPYEVALVKQLRDTVAKYKADGRAPPVHVNLAEKFNKRVGGDKEANAYKPGDRIPYVIIKGTKGDPVSKCGEDPVYAVDNGWDFDDSYYLGKHVIPAVLRVFEPTVCGDRTDIPGVTEKDRQRHRELITREWLFGSATDYLPPADVGTFDLSDYADRQHLVASVVRYPPRKRHAVDNIYAAARQRGTLCEGCGVFMANRRPGAICARCMTTSRDTYERDLVGKMAQLQLDEQHLGEERAALVANCQKCMHTAKAYVPIVCKNWKCHFAWKRLGNTRAEKECRDQMDDITESLFADADDVSATNNNNDDGPPVEDQMLDW